MSAPLLLLLSLFTAALGSTAQATVGFGTALILSPLLLAVLEPAEAVFCTLVQATVLSVMMLARERKALDLDRGVTLGLLLPAVPGVFAGVALLEVISKVWLQLSVGVIVLGFVLLQLSWRGRPDRRVRGLHFDALAPPAGFASGLLNGAVSTGGPPLAIWLHRVRASPDQIRHTLAVVFVAVNLTTLLALAVVVSPAISADGRAALAGALVGTPAGYAIGVRSLRRLSDAGFASLFLALLATVGVASAAAGLLGLF